MRKPVRIIKGNEIKESYSMKKAINAMERAFSSLSAGNSFVPLNYITTLPSGKLITLCKPAFELKEGKGSIKILTQRNGDSISGIPTIQGIILLIDTDTGEIISIMDGEYITALRTGAASGLATRYFARKSANTLAVFGCGTQGRTQMEAVLCEREIKKVIVYDKNKKSAEEFIADMSSKYNLEMICAGDISLLNEADVICTATNSTAPLFRREDLKLGVHINAIGSFQPHMQELDPYLLKNAKVYVDQLAPCLKESGDLINPIEEGIFQKQHIMGEIGDFSNNKITGRQNEDEITVFKSVGIAIQDYVVANDIYMNSEMESIGTKIDFYQ